MKLSADTGAQGAAKPPGADDPTGQTASGSATPRGAASAPQPDATPSDEAGATYRAATGRAVGASLRAAAVGDLDGIVELEWLAFGVEAWTRQMLAEELSGPNRRYWVVEVGGQVAGYAGVFLGWDSAEVMTIAVDPVARGQGLGRRLMERLLAEARVAGLRRVMLEVAVG
ncbi:MAG: GNAT family N-acetyltransferase, partial [Bifidobacteriaceae bacterium]|nr:GNAT family N-acetyltransferase [Bifidobacteriaceae bacterium]